MAKVVVIGAGPAGVIAAAEAAKCGHQVTLLEKNNKIGRKLYITGKGRCNLTNACDLNTLIKNTPGNGNFLYSTFSRFGTDDIVDYLAQLGVETVVERGNRVFPVSQKAGDVVDALYRLLKKTGVQLLLQAEVTAMQAFTDPKEVTYRKDGKEYTIQCDAVIVATGGVSYPQTGSTGDGYQFAEELGHTLIPAKPSLIPLVTKESWVKELQGLSLRNVHVSLYQKEKRIFEEQGEMLFTHYGVTGPLILSASSHIRDFDYNNLKLEIDLKPALTIEQLDARLQRDFAKYVRKNFSNALDDLLPQTLIPVIVALSGIEMDKPVNQITKEDRLHLAHLLKNLTVTPTAPRPIAEAIITAGGVCIKEVNPKTMESKLVPGVYFVGEVLDVDAYTGGFNLTIAFSTGYTAGNAIF